ncbi:hypothetical protein [Agreia sp. COWG]|uniref:hypothetical protein n=1 Tax=Agreia sp. COWG TaxID=2773266 RepID=UPI0019257865|nr:hypothetical protein [Agreia sp. COWG]CAD6005329.1 protein of unknown function [Agreia sp. COWG]
MDSDLFQPGTGVHILKASADRSTTGKLLGGTGGQPFNYYDQNVAVYAVLMDETNEVRFFTRDALGVSD